MKKNYFLNRISGRIISNLALIISIFLLFSYDLVYAETKKTPNEISIDTLKGLKDFYKDFFLVGVAVEPASLTGVQSSALILKHFGTITAENVMKPAPIHPAENRYFWDNADLVVNYAQANGMKVRGHTLVWHSQTAPWMFKDTAGNTATKEVVLARMKEHITQVVSRYKGKVFAWDVVNEAIDDNDAKTYRETQWYKICGEEYIAKAFQWAHEADPQALLFYNDYNTESPGKRDKVYNLVKKLLDAGVPIHGIGLQGHWNIVNPSEADLRNALIKYSSLGIKIHITELDVSVYTSGEKNPADNVFTPEREQKQLDQYKMIFSVLREYKSAVSSVTFWNVSDKTSWLNNFPVRGRKNYPLLFDQNLKPKKAYWEVVNF